MKPNYKRMAGKWRDMHSNAQETIGYLQQKIKYATDDIAQKSRIIEKQNHEINEWKVKYAELLTEIIRLLEAIKKFKEEQ